MKTRRSSSAQAMTVGVVAAGLAISACTPAPTPDTPTAEPVAPVIEMFTESHTYTGVPQTSVLRWKISDANKDELTCRIDRDGDGTFDRTIENCKSSKNDITNFTSAGTYNAILEVTDSTGRQDTALKTINVADNGAESFDIDLRLSAGMDPRFQAVFESAAARWESIIKVGFYDVPTEIPAGLNAWLRPFSGTVDDLMIDATVEPIDGEGGLLGQAGALLIREDNNKPYFGIMRFDSADLDKLEADGRLESTILHEMGHVLGMGGLWLIQGFVLEPLSVQPSFTGNAANAVFQELGGTGLIPLETGGGQGTALAHWKESRFGSELMTGYLNTGSNPLSKMTLASLADVGYAVDLGPADAYTLPPGGIFAGLRADAPRESVEVEMISPINVS